MAAPKHYVRFDGWLDINVYPLPSVPVLMADETLTVQWLSEKPSKGETADHAEPERDGEGKLIFEGDGSLKMKAARKVKAAFWVPVQVND